MVVKAPRFCAGSPCRLSFHLERSLRELARIFDAMQPMKREAVLSNLFYYFIRQLCFQITDKPSKKIDADSRKNSVVGYALPCLSETNEYPSACSAIRIKPEEVLVTQIQYGICSLKAPSFFAFLGNQTKQILFFA